MSNLIQYLIDNNLDVPAISQNAACLKVISDFIGRLPDSVEPTKAGAKFNYVLPNSTITIEISEHPF